MAFCHCVFFGVHINCKGLCSNKCTGHTFIPSCYERLSAHSTLTRVWIVFHILVKSMSSHLGPGELASVPWADSRSESPFRSGHIHTCICSDDTYVLPLLPVCQMFFDKYRTALGDGLSWMLIYFLLAAKVLMTLLAWEFLFGVYIFRFHFIFYHHKRFLFLFSWLVISWLNCFCSTLTAVPIILVLSNLHQLAVVEVLGQVLEVPTELMLHFHQFLHLLQACLSPV